MGKGEKIPCRFPDTLKYKPQVLATPAFYESSVYLSFLKWTSIEGAFTLKLAVNYTPAVVSFSVHTSHSRSQNLMVTSKPKSLIVVQKCVRSVQPSLKLLSKAGILWSSHASNGVPNTRRPQLISKQGKIEQGKHCTLLTLTATRQSSLPFVH